MRINIKSALICGIIIIALFGAATAADYYEYESNGRKLGTKSHELEIQNKRK